MRKYELSLSSDYVRDWSVIDAIRELFQNAIDQQAQIQDNEVFFDYDEDSELLRIGNKLSVLDPSSLLLGATTKRGDDNTIGQFGEGYKIASLVLVREGKSIRFLNYGRKEVWTPRFVKSRKYGAEILTFFVDTGFLFTKVPDNNLTIEIEGITREEYEQVVEKNLWLQDDFTEIPTDYGSILTDEQHKHKVFVNGLYICDHEKYEYGYDFKPEHIELDRDRKLVSDFNLHWLASKMWLNKDDEKIADLAADLVARDASDVAYVRSIWSMDAQKMQSRIANKAFQLFREKHGLNAVPVSSTEEMQSLAPGYTPIIVSETHKETLTHSNDYVEPVKEVKRSAVQRLRDWFDEFHDSISDSIAEESLDDIITELEQHGGN